VGARESKSLDVDLLPDIDVSYQGGKLALRKFLAMNLRFPIASQDKSSVGVCVASFNIDSDGMVNNITIINSIDKHIDEEVKRVIGLTKNNWLKTEGKLSNQLFYVQCVFTVKDFDYKFYPIEGSNILEPVYLVGFGLGNLPKSDKIIQARLEKMLEKEDYKKAVASVNELIKRNPFNGQLYKLRMQCNTKLDHLDLVQSDLKKICEGINNIPF
jgi:hypothetical protein